MRILMEMAFLLVALGGGAVTIGYIYFRRTPSTPDICKHRRWTKWKTVQEVPVHLYSEVDEGRSLPDRVDAMMEHECISCGLRQVKIVRGIDSTHYK